MSRKKGKKSKSKHSAMSTTPRRPPSKHNSRNATPPNTNTNTNTRGSEAASSMLRFSMVDEARWMSNHRTAAFDSTKQLRYMPIQFVSAGLLEGTIKDLPQLVKPKDTEPAEPTEPLEPTPTQESLLVDQPSSPDNTAGIENLTIRSPSPSMSESSRDEVVFQGRTKTPLHQSDTASVPKPPTVNNMSTKNTEPSTPQLTTASTNEQTSVLADVEAQRAKSDSDSDGEGIIDDQFAKRRGGKAVWEGYTTPWEHRSKPDIGWLPIQERRSMNEFLAGEHNSHDAAMDDYLQNMEEFGLTDDAVAASGFARREMDLDAGSHNDWDPETFRAQEKSGGEEEEDDDDDEEEEEEEEEELDDETIARVLQKQEELGLGSEELMLYPGNELFANASSFSQPSISFDRPNKKRQYRFRGSRAQSTFPSASAMADALDMDPYNGFDIMDTDRPSLRPQKKGRRGQMPLELEDSDLNEQMQQTWEADRTKKRLKKAEREELRRQGLLGRKGKAPDLKVKYKDGVSTDDILNEIQDFLMSDIQSLSLPPMERGRRAIVHQFALKVGVSSKSRGAGVNRFIVLSKTTRTKHFSNDEFERALTHKGFKFRMHSSYVAPVPRGQKGAPQVSYRDGDVVGASAPELGSDNKGRAMLEKMGWTKGTALGAVDNKGILLPIAHTVKTTKAGLQ